MSSLIPGTSKILSIYRCRCLRAMPGISPGQTVVPVVDLMRVEHNCGAVNLEFQLNGVEEQSGDVFCFPGYYPGDLDDAGNAVFNCCDTGDYYYGKVVEAVLSRARKVFDMEVTTSVEKQWQFHQTA